MSNINDEVHEVFVLDMIVIVSIFFIYFAHVLLSLRYHIVLPNVLAMPLAYSMFSLERWRTAVKTFVSSSNSEICKDSEWIMSKMFLMLACKIMSIVEILPNVM